MNIHKFLHKFIFSPMLHSSINMGNHTKKTSHGYYSHFHTVNHSKSSKLVNTLLHTQVEKYR